MNELNTTTNEEQPSKFLRLARHSVLIFLVSCINPFWSGSAKFGLSQSVENCFAAVSISALISGLALLFFTNGTGRDFSGNLIRSSWTFAVLIFFGNWSHVIK